MFIHLLLHSPSLPPPFFAPPASLESNLTFNFICELIPPTVVPLPAAALEKSTTLDDLHNLAGGDFFVILPCQSIARPGQMHEGTRLTLVAVQPEGYELTIRTPSTPQRWQHFDGGCGAVRVGLWYD